MRKPFSKGTEPMPQVPGSAASKPPIKAPASPRLPATAGVTRQPDSLAEDLIRRVVKAIDEWALANNLSKLPRNVVFEQALAIMTSLYEAGGGNR